VTKSPQPTPAAPAAATAPPGIAMADPLVPLRWLDVILVVLGAPIAILMGAPALGYLVGAAAWIVNRAIGALVERKARTATDVRATVGLNLGALIARSWLVGLTILAVGLAGEREDGLTAAILVLAAFTIYFATSLLSRSLEGKTRP
jgi:hypothetical protein